MFQTRYQHKGLDFEQRLNHENQAYYQNFLHGAVQEQVDGYGYVQTYQQIQQLAPGRAAASHQRSIAHY